MHSHCTKQSDNFLQTVRYSHTSLPRLLLGVYPIKVETSVYKNKTTTTKNPKKTLKSGHDNFIRDNYRIPATQMYSEKKIHQHMGIQSLSRIFLMKKCSKKNICGSLKNHESLKMDILRLKRKLTL